jgi:MSHA biogenesis protein MshP
VSTTSQAASAADQNSARALQAARAGTQWGLYELLDSGVNVFKTGCDGGGASASSSRNFGSTLSSFTVTVTCTRVSFTEGTLTVKAYSLVANACNEPASGSCPNTATTSSTYVERQLSLSLTN